MLTFYYTHHLYLQIFLFLFLLFPKLFFISKPDSNLFSMPHIQHHIVWYVIKNKTWRWERKNFVWRWQHCVAWEIWWKFIIFLEWKDCLLFFFMLISSFYIKHSYCIILTELFFITLPKWAILLKSLNTYIHAYIIRYNILYSVLFIRLNRVLMIVKVWVCYRISVLFFEKKKWVLKEKPINDTHNLVFIDFVIKFSCIYWKI